MDIVKCYRVTTNYTAAHCHLKKQTKKPSVICLPKIELGSRTGFLMHKINFK